MVIVDVWMHCLIMQCGENVENMKSCLVLHIIESILGIHAFISPICGEYVDGSIGKITSDIQMVLHACRVVSRALHAYKICETCHIWLCDLVNYVNYMIGE